MITFKAFIQEAIQQPWAMKQYKLSACARIAKEKCKHAIAALDQERILYRGFSERRGFGEEQGGDGLVIDTTNSNRTSADTNNVYQLLIDEILQHDKLPTRSSSLITSTNFQEAKSYSSNNTTYIILPFDDAYPLVDGGTVDFLSNKLGKSLYRAKESNEFDLFDMNTRLQYIFSKTNLSGHQFQSRESANNALHSTLPLLLFFFLDKDFSGTGVLYKQGGMFNQIYQEYRKSGQLDKLRNLTEDDLSPIGKKLLRIYESDPLLALAHYFFDNKLPGDVKSGDMSIVKGQNSEVWFTGKCVAIRSDLKEKFLGLVYES